MIQMLAPFVNLEQRKDALSFLEWHDFFDRVTKSKSIVMEAHVRSELTDMSDMSISLLGDQDMRVAQSKSRIFDFLIALLRSVYVSSAKNYEELNNLRAKVLAVNNKCENSRVLASKNESALTAQIKVLKEELNKRNQAENKLTKKLDSQEKRVEVLKRELNQTNKKLTERLSEQKVRNEQEKSALTAQIEALKEELNKRNQSNEQEKSALTVRVKMSVGINVNKTLLTSRKGRRILVCNPNACF